jgi:hypothetical protein
MVPLSNRTLAAAAVVLSCVPWVTAAAAATRSIEVETRRRVAPRPWPGYEIHRPYVPRSYEFRVEVLSEDGLPIAESARGGRPILMVRDGQRYSVRMHNPLPVRVAVNLSIDGLNSLDGSPSSPSAGAKWLLEPHSYTVIRGWQVGDASARRFLFTRKDRSYARWRSGTLGQDLSVNCGVIGASYFWSSHELEQHRPPIVYEPPDRPLPLPYAGSRGGALEEHAAPKRAGAERADRLALQSHDDEARAPARRWRAGTGMGERMSHPIRTVQFEFDAGMYDPEDSVIIYYDFPGPVEILPHPYGPRRGGAFAPEMPDR